MKQLEQANMRFEVSLVVQYQHHRLSLEKLIEAGWASLKNAAENYDHASDTKFIIYAVTHMRQKIKQTIEKINKGYKC